MSTPAPLDRTSPHVPARRKAGVGFWLGRVLIVFVSLDQPQAIAEAIGQVLEAARTGQPVRP